MIFQRGCHGVITVVLWQKAPSPSPGEVSKNQKRRVSKPVDCQQLFWFQLLCSVWFDWLSFQSRSKRRNIFDGPDRFSNSFLHFPYRSAALGFPSDCWEIQWVRHIMFNIPAHLSVVRLTKSGSMFRTGPWVLPCAWRNIAYRWPSVHTFAQPHRDTSQTIRGPFTDTCSSSRFPEVLCKSHILLDYLITTSICP